VSVYFQCRPFLNTKRRGWGVSRAPFQWGDGRSWSDASFHRHESEGGQPMVIYCAAVHWEASDGSGC
jgi:hypothetical protein